MKVYLTRRYRFCASHRLHNASFSVERNRATYGKCNNPYGHGHNYALEVTVSGAVDARTGMVCDLSELDQCVSDTVLNHFDHENLNCLQDFRAKVPTTENLAVAIYDILKLKYQAANLERIRLEETESNSFEYCGATKPEH